MRLFNAKPSARPTTTSGQSDPQRKLAPPIVQDVLRAHGRPLDQSTQTAMETRFGQDFSGVRVHSDPLAASSAQAVGALAYTAGRDIVFGSGQYSPGTATGRRLLTHELAHVVQQRGTSAHCAKALPIASATSPLERDAHRAAEHTGADHSISTHAPTPAVQRYTTYSSEQQRQNQAAEWHHPYGRPLMVADNGELAVEYNPWNSKMAWALPSLITQSNQTLTERGSLIRLRPGSGQIDGLPPAGNTSQPKTLREVEVTNPFGGPGVLRGDCGGACLEAMGSGSKNFRAVTRAEGTNTKTPAVSYRGGWGKGANTTTSELSGYIYQRIMREEFSRTLEPNAARAAYDKLPAARKDQIDRKYGINRYAVAGVGEGLTTGTEFDMPGFKTDTELATGGNMMLGGLIGAGLGLLAGGAIGLATGGALNMLAGGLLGGILGGVLGMGVASLLTDKNTWNFHFATTILRSGHDYVTIENVARRKPDQWLFGMYGPAEKNQSFHDTQGQAEHGNKYTSMVVDKP